MARKESPNFIKLVTQEGVAAIIETFIDLRALSVRDR